MGHKVPQQKKNGRLIAVINTELADLPNEQWKDIPDFDGYQISSHRRIKSLARYTFDVNGIAYFRQEKIFKLSVGKNKTEHISIRTLLMKDGARYAFVVPRLVYTYFVNRFDIYDQTVILIKKDHDYLNCFYTNIQLISVATHQRMQEN